MLKLLPKLFVKTISSNAKQLQNKIIVRNASQAMSDHYKKELNEIKNAGLYKKERVILSPQNSAINIINNNAKVLNFCANNYLGLSDNKHLIDAAKHGLESHGLGLSSVRFICGTQDIHLKLEQKISQFHEKEAAILYCSCFDANGGIFEALLTEEDAIISDKLNHASIIDGIRLSRAKRYLYEHLNLDDLETKLKDAKKNSRFRLVVTDGCFSMDGDIAPLKEIVDLANKYECKVMIDECHATGFLGKTGRGTEEYCNVKVDIINSTLGKALGGATGGYTTATQEIVDMLRQRSRPYLFSNALAPCLVQSSIACFDMIMKDTSLRDKLQANIKRFRDSMTKNGFKLMGDYNHPIAPVMLGDAKLAQIFAEDMLKEGIYVIGFSFPVVPKGQARIRVQLSAGHSFEQIDKCVEAFRVVGIKHGILKK